MGKKKTVTEENQPVVMRVKNVKLNLRKEPSMNAEVLVILKPDTSVIVDMEGSTKDFYKVTTATGTRGFCKKEFLVK